MRQLLIPLSVFFLSRRLRVPIHQQLTFVLLFPENDKDDGQNHTYRAKAVIKWDLSLNV